MSKPLRQVIAENVLTLIEQNENWNITSVAKLAGISRGQLNNIVTQATDTKMDTIEALSKVFNIQPAQLLTESTSSPQIPDGAEFYRHARTKEEALKAIDEIEPLMKAKLDDGEAILFLHGSTIEIEALNFLCDSFGDMDDEGKLSLLRHAALEVVSFLDVTGKKLPRDWRTFIRDMTDRERQLAQAAKSIAELVGPPLTKADKEES